MQILTAPCILPVDDWVDFDLVKHLLGLVGELLGGTVFLCQLQQHMGLVFLQICLGQQHHLFIDVLRLFYRIKSTGKRFHQFQCIAAGFPILNLALLLPQLELRGEWLHTQTGKGVVRQTNLPQKAETALHLPDHRLIWKIIRQERLGNNQSQDTQGLQQFIRLLTVVQLGQDLLAFLGPPAEVERRVAHHIIKTHLRLIGSDVAKGDIGSGKQISSHLAGFGVKLTPVEVGLHREEIEKTALPAGEVGHQVELGGLEDLSHQLTEAGRSKELPVLNLLFRLAVAVIVVKILPIQTVQATVSGIGIIDVLAGNSGLSRRSAVNQVENLLIEDFAALRIRWPYMILIFHAVTPFSWQRQDTCW